MNELSEAAYKLYNHLKSNHWNGEALIGPDPGLRFNIRIWRFVKSYLRFFPWQDNKYFLQCQGYWIWDNWKLYQFDTDEDFRRIAIAASDTILRNQRGDGYWEYPLREWRGLIATVDSNYAALGLLETFRNTEDQRYLDGALKWYEFLITSGGFQKYRDSLAVRYFAGRNGRLVPNNVTLTLQLFAEIYNFTSDDKYLRNCDEMIKFLEYSQKESGEFPYAFATPEIDGRDHFLCFQYNCFQFLDLARFWEIIKDDRVQKILNRLIGFIRRGQHEDGHAWYDCFKSYPEVTYYTAVLGAALLKAKTIGLGDFTKQQEKAYKRVLERQFADGGFIHSSRNYGVLSDKRSYPRYLSMILKHLLMRIENGK